MAEAINCRILHGNLHAAFRIKSLSKIESGTRFFFDFSMRPIHPLKYFWRNEKGFHAELAMTAVLHTHTR